MNMVRLMYVSKVEEDFDPSELDDILRDARERNTREDMTGLLFFTTSHFVQYIEGDSKAVNELYRDLMSDTRHTDLSLLVYGSIDKRMFASWKMAYIAPGDIEQEILEKHSIGPSFDPYSITESMATAMLMLLTKHLEEKEA